MPVSSYFPLDAHLWVPISGCPPLVPRRWEPTIPSILIVSKFASVTSDELLQKMDFIILFILTACVNLALLAEMKYFPLNALESETLFLRMGRID